MKKNKFKLNDRVFYVSGRWGDSSVNPLYREKYGKVCGTIIEIYGYKEKNYGILWDNGVRNSSYIDEDLKLDNFETFINGLKNGKKQS